VQTPPPGWYPDPDVDPASSAGRWRWWDGARWTGYVHDPAVGPRAEQARVARWVRIGVWVQPLSVLGGVAYAYSLIDWLRDADWDGADPFAESAAPTAPAWMSLLSPIAIALVVFVAMWLYRVVQTGAAIHGPGRRSPALAVVSLFIPILNLWWPCQALLGAVPNDAPARRAIVRWWLLYLVTSFAGLLALGLPFLPRVAAAAGTALLVGAAATYAVMTGVVIDAILTAHTPPDLRR
jgi:hypothetical protein